MAAGGAMMGVGMLESGIATLLQKGEVDKARAKYEENLNKYLPNIGAYNSAYFSDLSTFLPQARNITKQINDQSFSDFIGRREQALPGSTAALQASAGSVFDLMQGKLPPEVLRNFQRSGGASSVGKGWGGSGFGDLNTGLFGARGSLEGMQLGYSLLPTLFGMAVPNAPYMSSASLLQGIMNPEQRTAAQLQVRGQNLGIAQNLYSSPTGNMLVYQHMQQEGDRLAGMGSMGMMGGMGGGGAGAGSMMASVPQTSARNPAFSDGGTMWGY